MQTAKLGLCGGGYTLVDAAPPDHVSRGRQADKQHIGKGTEEREKQSNRNSELGNGINSPRSDTRRRQLLFPSASDFPPATSPPAEEARRWRSNLPETKSSCLRTS